MNFNQMFTQNQPWHTEAALSDSSSMRGSNRELSDLLSNHLFSIVTVYFSHVSDLFFSFSLFALFFLGVFLPVFTSFEFTCTTFEVSTSNKQEIPTPGKTRLSPG